MFHIFFLSIIYHVNFRIIIYNNINIFFLNLKRIFRNI
ncbi:unknown [Prevotella sp. CAG:1058]|nr:unknown [Prevotella sp. CAG:1058]